MPFSGYLNLQTGILLITVFLLVCYLVWMWQCANYPPGPIGFPILGYLPNLAIIMYRTGMEPYRVFTKLTEKYGKVYTIYMGSKRVVMITDYEAAREAFKNPHLNDRPKIGLYPESYLGVLLSSGKLWQHQRRFTLNQFRQLGIGKTSFQDKISEETTHLLRELHVCSGKPIDPCRCISYAVSNILCSVVFGKRFDYSDEDFRRTIRLLDETLELAGNGGLQLFIPILAHFQSKKHVRHLRQQLQSFIRNIVNDHRKQYDTSKVSDYVDVYLAELENAKNNNTAEENLTTDMSMYQTIAQLFTAGSETTVTTLRWSLLFMTTYPDIQSKVKQEIDSVVGRNRLPLTTDSLPFTEATIMEVQRFVTIAPLGVPHIAAEDTTLQGYTIPKGTIITSNIWGIHHDPKVWEDPEQFRPERFLDSKGNVCRPQEYMPFSIGRRKCLGEHLARMELFIIFSHLLHQFSFKTPPGISKPSLQGTLGASNAPKPFQIVAIKRN